MDNEKKLKNQVKKAVALSYNPDDTAPKIVAKGQGIVAEKIMEKAMSEGLPLYKDVELAESLMNLDIDESIPVELYEAVAEILIYINYLDNKRGKSDE